MNINSVHTTHVKDFSRIPQTSLKRSTFNRSHGLKTAFDSGYLVPIECQEVLPGDDVNMHATLMARLGPCVTPPMDNVYLDTHWFFVPSRLLWTNFTKMMGERVNPNDSIDYTVPVLNSGSNGFAVGSLADYLGIPPLVPNLEVNALPFRACAKIWDDWYRDENLQDSIIQTSDDLGDLGLGVEALNVLRKRGKRHDYFTSCLPWTQRGASVEIPLGTDAPVYGDGSLILQNQNKFAPLGAAKIANASGMTLGTTGFGGSDAGNGVGVVTKERVSETSRGTSGLYADLSSASSATINSLRMAFQLQVLLEQQARCGTRYVEILRGCFNTICPDARLQRSEYLGGSTDQIAFTTIAQQSQNGTTPQGNLVSQAQVVARPTFSKAFTEHGYLIGFASVRCDISYQAGLNRLWLRRGRFDFYWPALQHLGEQAVLNAEIYAQGADVTDEHDDPVDQGVFGYQERYAEYRYSPNMITGKLRSKAPQSLDVWHLAQNFTSLPKLNGSFIQENPPLKRLLTIQNEPEILLDAALDQIWTRGMDTYSIPGLIDHL